MGVNEEDQLRIISMGKGGDVKAVFDRLARGIKAVGDSVRAESGKEFMLDKKYGYIHSCPTNLGTGIRASVHVDLPGYTKEGLPSLKKRCEELKVQPRGTRESPEVRLESPTTSPTNIAWDTPRWSWSSA